MRHVPVLLSKVIESLNLAPGKNIIDCTLGDAGHSEEILKHTGPNGKLIGIDADAESLFRAKKYLYDYSTRVVFERNNFEHLQKILSEKKFGPVHGILMDFGWSSPQFEERGRGFSFMKRNESLDMRYDTHLRCAHMTHDPPKDIEGNPLYGSCTAAELVNNLSADDLREIFKKYGEENLSRELGEAIVKKREITIFETVGDLVDLVLAVYRKKLKTDKEIPWIGGLHPATKVFQALRIVVNDELGVIERVLPQAIDILESGGRLAVITFHSLEDRIVKHYFKKNSSNITIITKKPIVCSKEEYDQNPSSRSAKLRVIEKK
ncbi:MAG: 16S rRNA (cytosine(1402)-N(4))-methyltransferase RsmH [Candidatus Magasanikbacteria bacterium]|nr:16S rRNA (cytosine(1402)-N(4))-methyltransferase RsmH [Candidatus Magasanikbacteria bacterium]